MVTDVCWFVVNRIPYGHVHTQGYHQHSEFRNSLLWLTALAWKNVLLWSLMQCLISATMLHDANSPRLFWGLPYRRIFGDIIGYIFVLCNRQHISNMIPKMDATRARCVN